MPIRVLSNFLNELEGLRLQDAKMHIEGDKEGDQEIYEGALNDLHDSLISLNLEAKGTLEEYSTLLEVKECISSSYEFLKTQPSLKDSSLSRLITRHLILIQRDIDQRAEQLKAQEEKQLKSQERVTRLEGFTDAILVAYRGWLDSKSSYGLDKFNSLKLSTVKEELKIASWPNRRTLTEICAQIAFFFSREVKSLSDLVKPIGGSAVEFSRDAASSTITATLFNWGLSSSNAYLPDVAVIYKTCLNLYTFRILQLLNEQISPIKEKTAEEINKIKAVLEEIQSYARELRRDSLAKETALEIFLQGIDNRLINIDTLTWSSQYVRGSTASRTRAQEFLIGDISQSLKEVEEKAEIDFISLPFLHSDRQNKVRVLEKTLPDHLPNTLVKMILAYFFAARLNLQISFQDQDYSDIIPIIIVPSDMSQLQQRDQEKEELGQSSRQIRRSAR